MDTISCRELEMEGDLINLPLDGKGTDIAGTQLPAEQEETQIPGGEQDLIPRTIDMGGRPLCLRTACWSWT